MSRYDPINPAALAEQFEWVRTLARALVANEAEADDLAQDAWIAALTRQPRGVQSWRHWMGAVVRNLARSRWRARARREAREREVARPERVLPEGELLERFELYEQLVRAVRALPEPYRTAVLLRYFDGLSPVAIAERTGTPLRTVHTHLHRGLQRLRESLDRLHGGDRQSWMALLVPFSRTGIGVSAGALIMSTKLKVSLAAIVVVASLGGLLLVAGVGPEGPADDGAVAEVRTTGTPAELSESSMAELADPLDARAPQRAAIVTASTGSPATYYGVVHDPAGAPIEGATLALHYRGGGWKDREPIGVGVSDQEGRFRIDAEADPKHLLIFAQATGHSSLSREPIVPEHAIEIVLPWVTAVFGVVTDAESGAPLPRAMVSTWTETISAGADGTYRVPNIVVGRAVDLLAASEGFAEQAVRVQLREPKETRLDFALPRGVPLTIVVFDGETGSPLADAELYRFLGIGEPFARTDGDGRVDIRVVDGSKLQLVVKAVGYYSFTWIWDVAGTEKLTPRIPMLGLAWIEGTIRGPDGEAVQAGASAEIDGLSSNRRDRTQEDRQAHGLPGHSWYEVDRRDHTGTDANGHFVLAVLPSDDPYQLMVRDRKHAPARAGPFLLDSPGMRASVVVRLEAGATVQGRVVHNGEPWTNGFVVAKDSAGSDIVRDLSDGEGKYELGGLPAGEIRLRLQDWRGDVKGPEVTFVAEANGEYRQDIIWKEDEATIAGRVTERSGRPLAGVSIDAAHDGPGERHFASSKSETDGRYVLVVRPSLTYDVTVRSGPVTERRAGITAGAEGVDFVLSAIGKLRLRLVDADTGEPLRGSLSGPWSLAWRPSGEEAFHKLYGAPDAEGLLELDLPVGMVDVSLTLVDEGYTPRKLYGLPVAEKAGDPVTVELERGVSATLTFESESERGGKQTRGHLIFVVEESQLGAVRGPFPSEGGPSNMRINGVNMWLGEPGLLKRLLDPVGNEARHLGGLAPGRYWLRAFPDAFVFEPESFVVSDEDVRVTVRWRWR